MAIGRILSTTDIAASGLSAERLRMEVAANNIANAQSTRGPGGGPYRRQQVIFSAEFDDAIGRRADNGADLQGVRVVGVESDTSEMPQVYMPGHPDANGDGMVTMPNVSLPTEMVDMVTATRAYEANLRVLTTFREMAEQTLSLLRATG